MNSTYKNPVRFWSILSGISLLIMAIAAGYAFGLSFSQIYVEGDMVQTLNNIDANYPLYMTGAYLWCLILITDFIVSYGFYRYLLPFHKKWAIASGIIRFIYSIILGVGIVFLFIKDADTFRMVWSFGLFIIGFHLIATGIGAMYSQEIPKLVVALIIIAGIGYSLINGLYNFLPQVNELTAKIETILMIPMTIGELSFGIWILAKGGKSFATEDSSQLSANNN